MDGLERGRQEKARRGLIPGGVDPYGYRIKSGILVVHEGEAETLRLVYRLCAEEHRSLCGIAAELNRLGIPSAHGKTWRRTTAAQVVGNATYNGSASYRDISIPAPAS